MNDAIEFLKVIFQSLGLNYIPSEGDVWGILSFLLLVVAAAPVLKRKPPEIEAGEKKESISPLLKEDLPRESPAATEAKLKEERPSAVVLPIPWAQRLKKGLSRSRQEVWGKLELIFSADRTVLTEENIEEIEGILFGADLGPRMVQELMGELQKNAGKDFNAQELKKMLFDFLYSKMQPIQGKVDPELYQFDATKKKDRPKSVMIVGVNGAGKTTTIGKLATKLKQQGADVIVGACDTFRAAAVDQLEVWCQRAGAEMVRAKEGADPSGVAFETLQQATSKKMDYCLLDTAGRLHTKTNLMEELKKGKNVLSKVDSQAPDQVLLVIDAITGQNALKQAQEFHKTLGLTGLIFTKCDGSAKAGSAVSIVQELQVPIVYIGVGEDVEDLNYFNLQEYLTTLLNIES